LLKLGAFNLAKHDNNQDKNDFYHSLTMV